MREIQWLKEAEDELAAIVDYVLQNQGQKVAMEVYENILFPKLIYWLNFPN